MEAECHSVFHRKLSALHDMKKIKSKYKYEGAEGECLTLVSYLTLVSNKVV